MDLVGVTVSKISFPDGFVMTSSVSFGVSVVSRISSSAIVSAGKSGGKFSANSFAGVCSVATVSPSNLSNFGLFFCTQADKIVINKMKIRMFRFMVFNFIITKEEIFLANLVHPLQYLSIFSGLPTAKG